MKQRRSHLQSALAVLDPLPRSITHFRARLNLALIALLLPVLATTAPGVDWVAAPKCAQMPAGVVSCWRAEGDALDSAGNNNGVMVGNATYGHGWVGRSFVFDGDRDGVMVGTGTNLHLQNFTIEAWIKRASATVVSFNGNSNGSLFSIGTFPGGLGFWIQAHNNCLILGKPGGSSVSSSARISDTNWHHVAVTKQDKRVVFYLDGEVFPAPDFDLGTLTFSKPACLGGWFNRVGQVD